MLHNSLFNFDLRILLECNLSQVDIVKDWWRERIGERLDNAMYLNELMRMCLALRQLGYDNREHPEVRDMLRYSYGHQCSDIFKEASRRLLDTVNAIIADLKSEMETVKVDIDSAETPIIEDRHNVFEAVESINRYLHEARQQAFIIGDTNLVPRDDLKAAAESLLSALKQAKGYAELAIKQADSIPLSRNTLRGVYAGQQPAY